MVRLQEHFMYRHWKDQVAILQDIPNPLPWCPNRGMHMTAKKMIRHQRKDMCNRKMEMILRRRDVEVDQKAGEVKFSPYDQ